VVAPFLPNAEKVAAVRAAMPALDAGIYLNTGSAGPLPAETVAAMRQLEDRELAAGRSHEHDWEDAVVRMAEARAAAAAVIGAPLDAVALTHSTTDGLNAVAWAIDWRPGDRAVTTNHEHPALLGPLARLRERRGVDVSIVDVGDGGDDDRTLEAIERVLAAGTRLVALSHVLWTTGAVLPVARIAALAHAAGVLVLVDGAQAAGAIPVNVDDLGVDAYAFPAHKWLLGPLGMGALYVAPASGARLESTFAGHPTHSSLDADARGLPWPDARRFEWSNLHGPSVVGFARSCGWLSMFVGLGWWHARGAELAGHLADRLRAIEGVELVTPREQMATLVTFRIGGWSAQTAVAELGSRAFAIVRTLPALDAVRASVGAFNTEDELERFVRVVALLAAHTPETLPSRRLTILGVDA
jgi:L-cysteine/cystine lyase